MRFYNPYIYIKYIKAIGFRKKMKIRNNSFIEPYLNTTTSKLVENTKAFELTIIKELGKLTP
jgi:hypothetical protein